MLNTASGQTGMVAIARASSIEPSLSHVQRKANQNRRTIHVGYECGRLHARDLSESCIDEQIYAAVQRETPGLLDLAWSIATLSESVRSEFEIVASLLTFHIATYSIS